MQTSRFGPLNKLAAIASLVLLAGFSAPGSAQTTGCAPGASGALPVVNTGLPVVQIWTTASAPILNREDYVTACMRVSDGSVQPYGQGLFHGTIKIRGRGNSTWSMPKKGYRIKFDAAAAVLDMPAHKDWVLLANYADKTLMRNAVAMELSRMVGMPWTPRLRFAEFYLNDEFLGNYQLGEKIEVAPRRVVMTKMAKTDITSPNVSGGYLIETEFIERIDINKDRYFTTIEGLNFVMQEPSGTDVQAAQYNYISSHIQQVETAILSRNSNPTTGYPALIDIDSFIDYYLVQELMKNVDSVMASSVYLVKDRNAKLKMGPLWDFDLGAGNVDFAPEVLGSKGWYVRSYSAWHDFLFQEPAIRARAKERWKLVSAKLKNIDVYVDTVAAQLDKSQVQNFRRWPILNEYVWPNAVVLGSYSAEVRYLRDFLKKRVDWMDKNIGK